MMLTRSNLAGYLLALERIDEAKRRRRRAFGKHAELAGGRTTLLALWSILSSSPPNGNNSSVRLASSAISTGGTKRTSDFFETLTNRSRVSGLVRCLPRLFPVTIASA